MRHPLSLSLSLPLSLALSLSACGTSHADPVPIEELGERYAGVLCDAANTCYGTTVAGLFFGGGRCEDSFSSGYESSTLPLYEAAIANGTLMYDGTMAEECIAALDALGCEVFSTRVSDVCEGTVIGTLAAGAACTLDDECIGNAFCDHSGGACPGTCQARGGSGATCADENGCESGLRCSGGTCRVAAGDGAACDGPTGAQCTAGTICVGGNATTSGTCQNVDEAFSAALGAPCSPQMGPFCQEGLSCALDAVVAGMPTFVCVTPGAAGAACRIAIPDACPSDQVCTGLNAAMGDFDGTCGAPPGDGEPCGGLLNRCAAGTRCTAGTCAAVGDLGASCETAANCWSNRCEGGVCTAPMLCE